MLWELRASTSQTAAAWHVQANHVFATQPSQLASRLRIFYSPTSTATSKRRHGGQVSRISYPQLIGTSDRVELPSRVLPHDLISEAASRKATTILQRSPEQTKEFDRHTRQHHRTLARQTPSVVDPTNKTWSRAPDSLPRSSIPAATWY